VVIDRRRLAETGAVTLRVKGDDLQWTMARAKGEDRPWSRAPARREARAAPTSATLQHEDDGREQSEAE
jgi:competence protein ComEC